MTEAITPRIRGLKAYLEDAARQLRERPPDRPTGDDDGAVLYFGNWQDSHPRELLYADELAPADKLAWMVVKANSDPKAPAGFPSYDEFGRAGIGSKPTIAASIAMLRITRWISLCDRVRDDQGRYRGCVYALHDEPVSVTEAMYLDEGYITYVESMTEHGHRRVCDTARYVLRTTHERLEADRDITESEDPGDRFERRLAAQSHDAAVRAAVSPSGGAWGTARSADAEVQVKILNSASNQVKNLYSAHKHRVKNLNPVDANLKNDEKTGTCDQVKNLNPARARGGSSSFNKPTTTTTNPNHGGKEQPSARGNEESPAELHYPDGFGQDHRHLADRCLRGLPPDQAQQVLDELSGAMRDRAQTNPIKNPLRYLSTLAKLARSGEFLPSYAIDAAERRRRKAEQEERERRIDQASIEQAEAQIATSEPDPNNDLVKRLIVTRDRNANAKEGGK